MRIGDDHKGPAGISDAMERYGRPLEIELCFEVSRETLAWWRGLADRRTAEVVLLVRRPTGRYLLHTKAFYPAGTFRLLTGGIKAGEDLIAAAEREALEETGLEMRLERFAGVLHQRFVHAGEAFLFTSYLFEMAEVGGQLGVQDESEEITEFREIEADALLLVAEDLEALTAEWADWGLFRAAAHRLAARVILGEGAA